MANKKTTKRSLVLSVLSLLTCFVMLLGTTYAWFTDSVTSTGNIIKTGTLDVTLEYSDTLLDAASEDWKDASKGAIFSYDNWEPGYTQVKYVKIENEGSLALKFMLNIIPALVAEEVNLADVIDVYMVEAPTAAVTRDDVAKATPVGNLTGLMNDPDGAAHGGLAADEYVIVAIALKMRESAGNEYQDKSVGGSFAVQLLATQAEAEFDSFKTSDYDAKAEYPVVSIDFATKEDAAIAISDGDAVTVNIPEGAPAGNYALVVSEQSSKEDADGNTTVSMDIELRKDGQKVSDGSTYTVTINIGANKHVTTVLHNDAPVSNFRYDSTTGNVTFTTTSFSPFSVTYNDGAVSTVEELNDYVTRGGYIYLTNDIAVTATSGNAVGYTGDMSMVIDLNGYTITTKTDNSIFRFKNEGSVDNTITLKNGTLMTDDATWCSVITAGVSAHTTVNMEGLTVMSDKANSQTVKAFGGSTINITDCVFENKNGGGVIACGGTVNILGDKNQFTQTSTGFAPYNANNVAVSEGGTINVYGGTFVASQYSAIIMSTGGTMNIYGGSFATTGKDGHVIDAGVNHAESALVADALLNIYGGTFDNTNTEEKNDGIIRIWDQSPKFNTIANIAPAVSYGSILTLDDSAMALVLVSTEAELRAAINAGMPITLNNNIIVDADNTIVVTADAVLNLNGKTLAGVSDDADKNDDGKITSADNEVLFDVRGTMTVKNGTVTVKHTSTNLKWDGCTEAFYVAFNGTLNVENATVENLGGSDMAYAIDVVNATNATLNITNSIIKSSYIPVRIFNNGSGMNNVTIQGSTIAGVSRALWVHIYTTEDNGNKGVKDSTLNLNIFGNENNYVVSKPSHPYRIIEFGFTNPINFDDEGNCYKYVTNGVYTEVTTGNYLIYNANAFLWMESQADNFFAGKTIKMIANIDCSDVAIKVIKIWDPENRTVFDGQNYTISNLDISSATRSSNQALFTGTLDIKNVKVDGAWVQGNGYTAVLASTLYGNIDNCHVKNAQVFDGYWQAGVLAAQFNSGNVTNCSVENCHVYSGAAAGALVGIINETSGERKIENCVVKDCTVAINGGFGGIYDDMFGAAVGLINIENSQVYFTNCTVEGNTVKGVASNELYGMVESGTTVTVN